MSDNTQELREKILKVCHKYEDKEFMAVHGKCDMDLAAPRCAKRVKELEALLKSQTNQAVVEATRDSELIVSAIARQEGGKVTVSNSALVACSGKVMIEKNPPGIDGLLISELTQEVQTDE